MLAGSPHKGPEALNHTLESARGSPFAQASATDLGPQGRESGNGRALAPPLDPYPFLGLCVSQATLQPGLPPWTVWANAWGAPGPQHGDHQLEFLRLNPQTFPEYPGAFKRSRWWP